MVTQELDGAAREFAFAFLGVELVAAKGLEDLVDAGFVGSEVGGVQGDVVEVDDDEGVQEGAKDVVHERHEGGWGVGEAKRHDSVLEMAIPGSEGCLGSVGLRDADLTVARAEVEFCEHCGAV